MKFRDQISKLNQDSSHYTQGLNVFSLISAVLVWGHITSNISLWALPITIATTLIAYGSEIQHRKNNDKVIKFK